jgi:peptidoglycan/LPS O-acetylase OafA/YrhL
LSATSASNRRLDDDAISLESPSIASERRWWRLGNRGSTNNGKRLDIQGLRMVAVVSVVANHLSGHPVGGFVGVDVFFVISGFLITGHLVRDLDRTPGVGHYVADFYRRRVRRLFPAALLVIVATTLVSHALFNQVRYRATLHDGLWAAIFGANWHFMSLGTNYFTSRGPTSPFQHYWSLSVEEQFYLVWPIALFVFGLLVGASRGASIRRRQTAGAVAAAMLIVISLVYALHESTANAVNAYFSTYTRGWELGLGALLACVLPQLPKLSTWLASGMSWVGLGVIGYAVFTVHGGVGFPAPGAILPCVGASLVLAATSDGVPTRNFVLTNRASVFVGDISYSLYLVHFPAIILLEAEFTRKDTDFYIAATALSVGLATLMYALLERPVLESNWLIPKRARSRDRVRTSFKEPAVAGLVIAVVGLAAYAWRPGDQAATNAKYVQIHLALASPAAHPTTGGTAIVAASPDVNALQAELRKALQAHAWPTLSPSMDSVIAHPGETAELAGCGKTAPVPTSRCTWGDTTAKKEIILAGDSISMAYAPAMITIVQKLPGWRLRVLGAYGCSFASRTFVTVAQGLPKGCAQHNAAVLDEIRASKPAVLIVSNIGPSSQVAASMAQEIGIARSDIGEVVYLSAPPKGDDPKSCYTPASTPADCVSPVADSNEIKALQAAKSQTSGTVIDTTSWFCASGLCPAFSANIPIRYDDHHITPSYAQHLVPVLSDALKEIGVS